MSDQTPDQNLHLPSLVIKNFRGIDELTIPRLGRVTLLAGENGVGKTTVLDAVRVWAARAGARTLSEVLRHKDEVVDAIDVDGTEIDTPDWRGLFYRRLIQQDQTISIGLACDTGELQIRLVRLNAEELNLLMNSHSGVYFEDQVFGFRVTFQGINYTMPVSYTQNPTNPRLRHRLRPSIAVLPDGGKRHDDVPCNTLGPDISDNLAIERFLDDVALTPHELSAVEALNLVTSENVQRVAILGSSTQPRNASVRRAMVLTERSNSRVPLRSLGDGAVRIFTIALALAASRGGFLLIDEAENGIHHSIQTKLWNMVLQTAARNDVQVIATTHSWDCVVGFAKAANELDDAEGVLYRIQRNGERLRAVEYPESELAIAAQQRIEVR